METQQEWHTQLRYALDVLTHRKVVRDSALALYPLFGPLLVVGLSILFQPIPDSNFVFANIQAQILNLSFAWLVAATYINVNRHIFRTLESRESFIALIEEDGAISLPLTSTSTGMLALLLEQHCLKSPRTLWRNYSKAGPRVWMLTLFWFAVNVYLLCRVVLYNQHGFPPLEPRQLIIMFFVAVLTSALFVMFIYKILVPYAYNDIYRLVLRHSINRHCVDGYQVYDHQYYAYVARERCWHERHSQGGSFALFTLIPVLIGLFIMLAPAPAVRAWGGPLLCAVLAAWGAGMALWYARIKAYRHVLDHKLLATLSAAAGHDLHSEWAFGPPHLRDIRLLSRLLPAHLPPAHAATAERHGLLALLSYLLCVLVSDALIVFAPAPIPADTLALLCGGLAGLALLGLMFAATRRHAAYAALLEYFKRWPEAVVNGRAAQPALDILA